MRHIYDDARRIANNTLEEANRHLNSGKIKNPRHHQMLTSMIKDATQTLNNLDAMENSNPYSDTNMGYGANVRGRNRTSNDRTAATNDAMDMINRILPFITEDMDDRYDVDARRGVPGTGRRRVRRVRADRYDDDMDNDMDDMDDMDDYNVTNMPRWRSARTGRFLPNLYGPRRVRRVRRRRSDMDDRYDDRYDDDMDDDRYYDRYDDRTSRSNDRYDNRTSRSDDRNMNDTVARVAAEATANTARNMADDRYNTRNATTPVMARGDNRYDNARNDSARYDDRRYDTSDNAHRPGPRQE